MLALPSVYRGQNVVRDREINVAFAGGGVLLFMHVGAIWALKEAGIRYKAVAGTSAGAIAAALTTSSLSAGEEINELALSLVPLKKRIVTISWSSVFSKYGFMDLRKLQIELANILPKQFKDTPHPLTVYTSNLDDQSLGVWSSKETPMSSISHRVVDSCRIPGIFRAGDVKGETHTDGGLIKNYPIDAWSNKGVSPLDVLGIRFDGTIAGPLQKPGPWWQVARNAVRHFAGHISLAMKYSTVQAIEDAQSFREVVLSVPKSLQKQGVDGISFNLTKDQAWSLIKAGYAQTKVQLEG